MGTVLFILYFFTNEKSINNIFQKLLSLIWFYIGYKLYIEFIVLENNLSLLYCAISFLFGIMLFLNYIKFLTAFFTTKGVISKFTLIVNFVVFNTKYGIFEFNKFNKIIGDDVLEGANYYINMLFVFLNFLPFLANKNLIGRVTNKYMLADFNSVGYLTLFLLTFKHESVKNSYYYFVVEVLCCAFLFFKFINDCFNRNMNLQNALFFVLFMINTYLLLFMPVDLIPTPEVSIPRISYQGFLIRESLFKDAGIEGFYGLDLFVDENMKIANQFIEIGCEIQNTNISSNIDINNIDNIENLKLNLGKMKLSNICSKEFRNIYPKYDIINMKQ